MAESCVINCSKSLSINELIELIHANVQSASAVIADLEYNVSGNRLAFKCYKFERELSNLIQSLIVPSGKDILKFMLNEGAIWEYVFYHDGKEQDLFSPCRQYWGEDDSSEWVGNPDMIAEFYKIEPSRIRNYYKQVDYDTFISGDNEPAYEGDKNSLGSVYQAVSFMEKLGFYWPNQEFVQS